MVPPDPMVERIALAQRDASDRAARLRGAISVLAERLFVRGATRVVLFGSLAYGGQPHAGTDIDLCVEGLSDSDLGEAALDLAEVADARVDLVRWESAGARLRRWILDDGLEIRRGAG